MCDYLFHFDSMTLLFQSTFQLCSNYYALFWIVAIYNQIHCHCKLCRLPCCQICDYILIICSTLSFPAVIYYHNIYFHISISHFISISFQSHFILLNRNSLFSMAEYRDAINYNTFSYRLQIFRLLLYYYYDCQLLTAIFDIIIFAQFHLLSSLSHRFDDDF